VAYNGSNFSVSIAAGLNYWVNFNNANTTAVVTNVPNINTSDNSTAEHYLYAGGDNCVEVEHYKILNGGHTWPGAVFNTGTTNRDINASLKIWEFFLKYDINGKIGGCTITSVDNLDKDIVNVKMYPNPVSSQLTIDTELKISEIKIVDITNKTIRVIKENINVVNVADLTNGIYFIKLITADRTITKKFIKQ
jgi:polyhydroxybutyrate depolymerase